MFSLQNVEPKEIIRGLRLDPGFEKIQRAEMSAKQMGDNGEVIIIKVLINVNHNKHIYLIATRKNSGIEFNMQALYEKQHKNVEINLDEAEEIIKLAKDYNKRLMDYSHDKKRVEYLKEAYLTYIHDYKEVNREIKSFRKQDLKDPESYEKLQKLKKRKSEIELSLDELETKTSQTFRASFKLYDEVNWKEEPKKNNLKTS